MKKLMVVGSTLLVALSLAACNAGSYTQNSSDYHESQSTNLKGKIITKSFFTYGSLSWFSSEKDLNDRMNRYLFSIKNIDKYNVSHSLSVDENGKGSATLVLTRK